MLYGLCFHLLLARDASQTLLGSCTYQVRPSPVNQTVRLYARVTVCISLTVSVISWQIPESGKVFDTRMASLAGHIIPGCFFLIYGVWWAIISFWTSLRLRSDTKKPSKHKKSDGISVYRYDRSLSRKSWIPQPFCRRIPLEPILKILLPLMGVIVEEFFTYEGSANDGNQHLTTIVYTPVKDGHFTGLGKLQHITMYSVFLTSGIIDLLSLCVHLPRHTSQLFLTLAFLAEALLFYFHIDSEAGWLNTVVHWILAVIILICVVFATLRILQSTNLFINTGFAYSVILQGTWFIQGGYLMFPFDRNKPWLIPFQKDESTSHSSRHDAVMFTVVCLVCHIFGLALFLLVLWITMRCLTVRRNKKVGKGQVLRLQRLSPWVDTEERERLIDREENPLHDSSVQTEKDREDGDLTVEMEAIVESAA